MTALSLGVALDADLGDALASGVLGPVPTDLAAFEQAFMEHVAGDWDAFYDATLARVQAGWGRELTGTGTVATFTRIWSRAAALSRGGTVVDVGSCFGFLPLAWSLRRHAPRLVAADLSAPAVALASAQGRRLGSSAAFVQADGARLPLLDRSAGTVLLLHVLEHLPPLLSVAVLREALRVADARVVVAVPVEEVPDPLFGHVQAFDLRALDRLGAATGWHATLRDADGAWLVLDRPR